MRKVLKVRIEKGKSLQLLDENEGIVASFTPITNDFEVEITEFEFSNRVHVGCSLGGAYVQTFASSYRVRDDIEKEVK